jgi:hypothetical protein
MAHVELLSQYGTEWALEKGANAELMKALMPVMGYSAMSMDSAHSNRHVAEAEAMNELARILQARKMEGMIGALGGGLPKESSARLDSLASSLAKVASIELEKDAFGALMALGRGFQGLGKGVAGGAKGLLSKASPAGGGIAAMKPIGRIQQAANVAEQKLTGLGQRIQGKLSPPGPEALRSQIEAGKGVLGPGAGGARSLAPGSLKPPDLGALTAGGAGGAPAAAGRAMPKPPPMPPPTPASAASGKPAPGKPLIGLGTKAKVMGGLAVAGAGYAGYKGLQTGRDYLMQPTGAQQWGSLPPLKHEISAYGY